MSLVEIISNELDKYGIVQINKIKTPNGQKIKYLDKRAENEFIFQNHQTKKQIIKTQAALD